MAKVEAVQCDVVGCDKAGVVAIEGKLPKGFYGVVTTDGDVLTGHNATHTRKVIAEHEKMLKAHRKAVAEQVKVEKAEVEKAAKEAEKAAKKA